MISSPKLASASRSRLARCAALALAIAGLLTGCGASSKPAYCSDVTNFKNAVDGLTGVASPSALAAQVKQVVSTGQTALTAVKSDFPTETSAAKSSLAALENSATQLSGSNKAAAVVALPGEVQAGITAAKNFANAAKSKCG